MERTNRTQVRISMLFWCHIWPVLGLDQLLLESGGMLRSTTCAITCWSAAVKLCGSRSPLLRPRSAQSLLLATNILVLRMVSGVSATDMVADQPHPNYDEEYPGTAVLRMNNIRHRARFSIERFLSLSMIVNYNEGQRSWFTGASCIP